MCCVFGFTQYRGVISKQNINRLTKALAVYGQVRGKDATGVAYNRDGVLEVFKRPLPAESMSFKIPARVRAVLGHTRMTTQGSALKNRNNHPFTGNVSEGKFAFAHNGMLRNDSILRDEQNLPKTPIETDSYVVVQLLEKFGRLDFSTFKKASELTRGAFVYTVLDSRNNMYFVVGDNPLCIAHFERKGIYVYASTEEILTNAIKACYLKDFDYTLLRPDEGDMIKISNTGKLSTSKFEFEGHIYRYNTGYGPPRFGWDSWTCDDLLNRPDQLSLGCGYDDDLLANYMDNADEEEEYMDILCSIAASYGYSEDDVMLLLNNGYDIMEIEELLNSDPFMFRVLLREASGI